MGFKDKFGKNWVLILITAVGLIISFPLANYLINMHFNSGESFPTHYIFEVYDAWNQYNYPKYGYFINGTVELKIDISNGKVYYSVNWTNCSFRDDIIGLDVFEFRGNVTIVQNWYYFKIPLYQYYFCRCPHEGIPYFIFFNPRNLKTSIDAFITKYGLINVTYKSTEDYVEFSGFAPQSINIGSPIPFKIRVNKIGYPIEIIFENVTKIILIKAY